MNLNQKKDEIQKKALSTHAEFDGYSTLAMCTGSGKSRCAVLRAIEIVKKNPNAKIFLAVPTEKLRDQNWQEEFEKWGAIDIFNKNLTRACYVSLYKYTNCEWDLVLLDEVHHITPACFPFFTSSEIHSILGLTATYPKDKIKKNILDTLAPISFNYPLEQGLKDGVVAPFTVDVIWTDLDATQKIVNAGPKSKPFKTTEVLSYQFWDNSFTKNKEDMNNLSKHLHSYGWSEEGQAAFELMAVNRGKDYLDSLCKTPDDKKYLKKITGQYFGLKGSRFRIIGARKAIINNAINKERIANRFINEIFEDDRRYLIFCGGIDQSVRLLGDCVFNSKSDSQAYDAFLNEELNILGVVNAVNEGTNIPNLDEALIIQISAQELHLIQRIGRVIRVREGHLGKIYIICVRGTQDEVWLRSALKGISNIEVNEWDEKDFFEQIKSFKLAS